MWQLVLAVVMAMAVAVAMACMHFNLHRNMKRTRPSGTRLGDLILTSAP